MTDQTFGKNRRSILLLITAGLVLMLVSTLSYFSANPGLVSYDHRRRPPRRQDSRCPQARAWTKPRSRESWP